MNVLVLYFGMLLGMVIGVVVYDLFGLDVLLLVFLVFVGFVVFSYGLLVCVVWCELGVCMFV